MQNIRTVKKKGMIPMTGSNAKILETEKKAIVMTHRPKKNSLAAQKFAGAAALAAAAAGTFAGNEFAALLIIAPMALAAILSKEKIMDFGIFRTGRNN